jgi:hypothetical protein
MSRYLFPTILLVCCLGVLQCTTTGPDEVQPSQPTPAVSGEQVSLGVSLPEQQQGIHVVPIVPHWSIRFSGMHTPNGPPGCWYNPLSPIVYTYPLSCHRPGDLLELNTSFEGTIQFSVGGDGAAEINWNGFRGALARQEGITIGGRITTSVTITIGPWDCLDATVWVFVPYECLMFDVTWQWLSLEKVATVYVWRPVGGACLVWTDVEFQESCQGCEEPPSGPYNGNWFCGSDRDDEPVWADWCDRDCTDNPGAVECVEVPQTGFGPQGVELTGQQSNPQYGD